MRKITLLSILILTLMVTMPVHAAEQISYTSQPDTMTVFLNGIAFARDTLHIPGDADIQVILPQQIFQNTLIIREGDARVPVYSVSAVTGIPILKLGKGTTGDLREITLEYLTAGIGWTPFYTMSFSQSAPGNVGFDFFAQIQNDVFTLDEVTVSLAAGRVDTSQQLDEISTITTNQYLAGYDQQAAESPSQLATGAVTIQYVYQPGNLTSQPGDQIYVTLLETELPARRVLLWNATSDLQASVIYKVRNTSELALSEGIVRSYEDGLFIGSDMIEFTPVESEGSVTVGQLQDVRVNRAETILTQDLPLSRNDILHQVTLDISNYTADSVELEVVAVYPAGASNFEFTEGTDEPARETGNILRWVLTIPTGETVTLNYNFRTPY